MTAEIGILNKTGVALAADSAVTVNNGEKEKVFNYANKLFSISENHSIGIMIYGNANIMSVPWEIVIKTYRGVLGDVPLSKVEDYSHDFIQYVETNPHLFSVQAEDMLIVHKFNEFLLHFLNDLQQTLNQLFGNNQPETAVKHTMFAEAYAYRDALSRVAYNSSFDSTDLAWFLQNKTHLVDEILKRHIFIALDQETIDIFKELAAYILFKDVFLGNNTGLVISGFGEAEIFPSLYEYSIEGIYNQKLKYKLNDHVNISNSGAVAAILPFAQQEMVHSFLNGIDPSLSRHIEKELHNVLTNLPSVFDNTINSLGQNRSLTAQELAAIKKLGVDLFQSFQDEISDYKANYSAPITDAVEFLPKEEMASMAEALVNLTSLKRKVTIEAETVGGPVDVAVITKGDGFIWIKRKHYFDPNLNAQYFKRR